MEFPRYRNGLRFGTAFSILIILYTAGAAAAQSALHKNTAFNFGHVLSRGINITDWFRNPPSRTPQSINKYLNDDDIEQIVHLGFTFVRLPIQPDIIQLSDGSLKPDVLKVLLNSVQRLEVRGLGVMIVPFHDQWDLENSDHDKKMLEAFWNHLGSSLAKLDSRLTFVELLNEPVFPSASDWLLLSSRLASIIRRELPRNVLVVSGNEWGSITGLLRLRPFRDKNVIYSIHYYDPVTLTSHAAWDKKVDGAALHSLPFPVNGIESCKASVSGDQSNDAYGLGSQYCLELWDDSKIRARIHLARTWADANQSIVIAPEFGMLIQHERDSRLRYLRAVKEAFEAEGIGWGLWGYDDSFGFGIPPSSLPSTPRLDSGTITALGLTEEKFN